MHDIAQTRAPVPKVAIMHQTLAIWLSQESVIIIDYCAMDRLLRNRPTTALSEDPSNVQRNRPIAQRNRPIAAGGKMQTADLTCGPAKG